MSRRQNPASAKQFAEEQGSRGYGVGSVQSFSEPTRNRVQSQRKDNRTSSAFVFNNSDIARDRGTPNALSKETTGTVYGGAIN
jgi:hypothetical protein